MARVLARHLGGRAAVVPAPARTGSGLPGSLSGDKG